MPHTHDSKKSSLETTENLVEAAKKEGGQDNITVVLVDSQSADDLEDDQLIDTVGAVVEDKSS